MPWNSVWPDGSKSVKNNQPTGQQNTTYLEDTLVQDHFFNEGATLDGHHRFMQLVAYTSGGSPANPTIATGMDGVLYTRSVQSTNQILWRNLSAVSAANPDGITQVTPIYLTGTVNITSTSEYTNVVTVPIDCYGEIYLYSITGDTQANFCHGYWQSHNSRVRSYSNTLLFGSNGTTVSLANSDDDTSENLNIQAKLSGSGSYSGTYVYQVKGWKTDF